MTHVRIRAPGRVNLIGEHVDYNDLSVLPMALGRGIEIDYSPRDDDRVRLANDDPSFAPREFRVSEEIEHGPGGDWGNYARAAAQAVRRAFGPLRGLEGEVRSDLPVAAGLSSSAALVVAVALALLERNEVPYDPLELAELLARGERYVGTQGGGMDQAICLLGRPGHALRIDFAPLAATPIPVPGDWRFVVASTLVRAEKSGRVKTAYNDRTRACAEALQAAAPAVRPDDPPASYRELLAVAPADQLLADVEPVLDPVTFRRFRHVVTETARVTAAEEALRTGDRAGFGTLMTASHESLRDDYEVSSPELDALVETALDAGAAGARLTGAGFGGCAIALATADASEGVMEALRARYYAPRGPAVLDDALFEARPSGGAGRV